MEGSFRVKPQLSRASSERLAEPRLAPHNGQKSGNPRRATPITAKGISTRSYQWRSVDIDESEGCVPEGGTGLDLVVDRVVIGPDSEADWRIPWNHLNEGKTGGDCLLVTTRDAEWKERAEP